jgi:hypothetical protein
MYSRQMRLVEEGGNEAEGFLILNAVDVVDSECVWLVVVS